MQAEGCAIGYTMGEWIDPLAMVSGWWVLTERRRKQLEQAEDLISGRADLQTCGFR
jgi:hypothetical protein